MVATSPKPADPVDVLLHRDDPNERSQAHKQLAQRAVARNDKTMAAFHFREALDLDPTDETTAEELKKLTPTESKTLFQRLFGR